MTSPSTAMAVYAPAPNPANVPPYGIWTTDILYRNVADYWKQPTQAAGVMVPVPTASTSAPVSAPTDQVGVASVRPRPTSSNARRARGGVHARQASPVRLHTVDALRKRGGVHARLGVKGKIGKNRVSYRPNRPNPTQDLESLDLTHELKHFMPYKTKRIFFKIPSDDAENDRIAVVGDSHGKKLWRWF